MLEFWVAEHKTSLLGLEDSESHDILSGVRMYPGGGNWGLTELEACAPLLAPNLWQYYQIECDRSHRLLS